MASNLIAHRADDDGGTRGFEAAIGSPILLEGDRVSVFLKR
jgi:hypothetical protein